VAKQLIHVCKKLYKRLTMDVEGIFSFLSARPQIAPCRGPRGRSGGPPGKPEARSTRERFRLSSRLREGSKRA
jgi:hypothetical protein